MGPLAGIKVVELAAIGPAPFCCMLLADMGAEVLRVDRVEPAELGAPADPRFNLLNRSRRSVKIDLKRPEGVDVLRTLVRTADVFIDGFRPGVTERLGVGPTDCLAINSRLVYGRMTGWGQSGPLASTAGHDINYIALAGALNTIGPRDGAPVPPLNLLGDFGGGAMYLAVGVLAALVERQSSGKGQIVDAAMIDGIFSLMTWVFGAAARGAWKNSRGENLVDGGRPWYGVYETKDGKFVSIGSIEGRFYKELLERTGLDTEDLPLQHDESGWPKLRERLTNVFRSKTREEWCAIMEGSDACFAPVLDIAEAQQHPHNLSRGSLVEMFGILQPAPAPRFSRTPSSIKGPPATPGAHTTEVLKDWGYSEVQIDALRAQKAID